VLVSVSKQSVKSQYAVVFATTIQILTMHRLACVMDYSTMSNILFTLPEEREIPFV